MVLVGEFGLVGLAPLFCLSGACLPACTNQTSSMMIGLKKIRRRIVLA